LREIRLEDLRRNIAVVEQVPYFFRASLWENIMNEGRVVETGPPSKLLAADGFLSRQFRLSRISPANVDVAHLTQGAQTGIAPDQDGVFIR